MNPMEPLDPTTGLPSPEHLVADVAETIADWYGRATIDADYDLAEALVAKVAQAGVKGYAPPSGAPRTSSVTC